MNDRFQAAIDELRAFHEVPRDSITLYDLEGPAIIVSDLDGDLYSNQTNGVLCDQDSMRGRLLVLGKSDAPIFDPGAWYDHAFSGKRVPSLLFEALNRLNLTRVGINEIEVSEFGHEAWWNIRVREGDIWHDAVVTWPNCD